ncbi:putative RNA-directed DNA polymerase [Aphis craccivora]|uniref:Putative RNA-directed DNA polymerase n=1 Tax=Aphis craccivora TaxID=307492 RepID=A0A6G0YE75_APHCR|nr:putative RNA-directed DNA polymerase [Aphis craccivora]
MNRVLLKCNSRAPGPDGIPHKCIHNQPVTALNSIIQNFFTDRTFQVKCNERLSKIYFQKNGVSQQSPVKCTLFADDFNIFCRGINTNRTINFLQNTLQDWSLVSGFSFSVEESQCTFFINKRNIGNTSISMNSIPLPIKNSIKILGILFDSRNTWIPHLKVIRNESLLRMNTLKCIAHQCYTMLCALMGQLRWLIVNAYQKKLETLALAQEEFGSIYVILW